MKTKKLIKPELIIQFVGKRKITDPKTGKEKFIPATAPLERTNGSRTIPLPRDEVQKAGFKHPDAEFLLKNYRSEFKRKKGKGKGK